MAAGESGGQRGQPGRRQKMGSVDAESRLATGGQSKEHEQLGHVSLRGSHARYLCLIGPQSERVCACERERETVTSPRRPRRRGERRKHLQKRVQPSSARTGESGQMCKLERFKASSRERNG